MFGAIFARGGSKGIANKNLRLLGGTSLLGRSIGIATAVPEIDRVICSTDSPEIAAEARRCGAETPFMRPAKLAADDSPEWASWKHLAHYLVDQGADPHDVLVSLPTTAPLRSVDDVQSAIALLRNDNFDLVLGVTPSLRSPWFNMVEREPTGQVLLVAPPEAPVSRRQDAPPTFDITTVVYATRLSHVIDSSGVFDGRVGSILIPRERSIDIDTGVDLEYAEFLITTARTDDE